MTQLSLDQIGTPLSGVSFVVVDLETTGGAPADAGITEFGAVRIQAGEVIGEFATLVNPGVPIPPFIAALTGITDAAVATAPRLEAVLPSFLEFCAGAVLVAHNAPYDIGFLRGGCERLQLQWPDPIVLDTVRLARQILPRDEVRDCKLGTLARHFNSPVRPTHRALDDARATVAVFHALIERAGSMRVETLEELRTLAGRVAVARHAKRHLADSLPHAPGVYVFEAADGEALYVGTSKDLRTRVRTYFTASEQRARMTEMIGIAERVVPIVCATALEANVREIRTIAERQPRYNRRSRHPERDAWIKLTVEAYPRLSLVNAVSADTADGSAYLGPFRGRATATLAAEAIVESAGLRTCLTRLARAGRPQPACVLADIDRCLAPCRAPAPDYALRSDAARRAMTGDVREVAATAARRMQTLAAAQRYEDAAGWRDRLAAFVAGSARASRLSMIAATEQITAASPTPELGWEVHVIRYGRLAGAAVIPPGVDPRPHIEAVEAVAESVRPSGTILPSALIEETELVMRWLFSGTARLVSCTAPLSLPLHCGGAERATLARSQAADEVDPSLEESRSRTRGQGRARPRVMRSDAVA